jgi:hypothetical protein
MNSKTAKPRESIQWLSRTIERGASELPEPMPGTLKIELLYASMQPSLNAAVHNPIHTSPSISCDIN